MASTVDGEILTGHYFKQQKKHGIAFKQFVKVVIVTLMGSDCLMFEGGDNINLSLLQDGLIDEVRILVLRLKDNMVDTSNLFERSSVFADIVIEKF